MWNEKKNCLNKVDKFRCKLLMKKNMNKKDWSSCYRKKEMWSWKMKKKKKRKKERKKKGKENFTNLYLVMVEYFKYI